MESLIRRAGPGDLSTVTLLIRRYSGEWRLDLHDTPEELLASLSAPVLGFYLAERAGAAVGCVLGRPCPGVPGAAECKRLYVVPSARGLGLARRLLQTLESEARAAGFHSVYLDSRHEFTAAIQLYRNSGYTPCPRFNDNQQASVFFRKALL